MSELNGLFLSNKFYNEMKTALAEENYKMLVNFDELLQFDASMFEYDGIPEEAQQYFNLFELWLCTHRCVAFGKIDDKLVFACGDNGGGRLDNYGFMNEFVGATRNGKSVKWKIGEECVVFWNNKAMTPDFDLFTTAESLAEIDVSMDDNVLYSRFYPVPLAKDQRQKTQIENIFDKLKKGGKKTSVIDRPDDLSDLLESGSEAIPVMNLTDVKNSDKIQYLTHAHDDVKRWFYVKYGQAVQGTGKQAQQSIEEIDGTTSVSFIYPLNKFYMRKKACEEMNALFGTNMSVRFSPAWAVEFAKFAKAPETDEIEEIENANIENEEIDVLEGKENKDNETSNGENS